MGIQGNGQRRGMAGAAVGLAMAAMALTTGAAVASAERPKAQTLETARPTAPRQARPSIVSGTPIAISAAPWQVYLSTDGMACGGVILDSTRVLTAAHCLFDPATNVQRAATAFTVRAGVSNLAKPASGDVPQSAAVASARIHPGYVQSAPFPKPDDVAVLQLKTALNLSGPTARPIAITTATPGGGTPASLTGYGQQNPAAPPNGQLYALATGVGDPLACAGPNNAVVVCVASPTGSACSGDSGGPLTVGSPAVLAGVASFAAGSPPCQIGSMNGYTNLAAPEIAAFIAGSDTPPLAPRGGTNVTARGIFRVGSSMTCAPGDWTNGPSFTYAFLNVANGAVLQSGASPTYAFRKTDLGQSVACQVAATTAGGTAVGRTIGSPAIGAALAPNLAVSVRGPKRMIKHGAAMRLTIRVVNRGETTARRVRVCNTISRGMAFVRVPKRSDRSRRKVCWRAGNLAPGRGQRARLTVRTPSNPRVRRAKTTVTVRAANAPTRRAGWRLVARRG